jgi:hypothetical protein
VIYPLVEDAVQEEWSVGLDLLQTRYVDLAPGDGLETRRQSEAVRAALTGKGDHQIEVGVGALLATRNRAAFVCPLQA